MLWPAGSGLSDRLEMADELGAGADLPAASGDPFDEAWLTPGYLRAELGALGR
jgi:hypothetical protein